MTITLELSTDQERRLREYAALQDAESVRQVLLQAVSPAVETLLQQPASGTKSDFEVLAGRLLEGFAAATAADARPLSDEALTREGIYGDHP